MNLIKSLFVSGFTAVAWVAAIFSAQQLYAGEQALAWTGALLAHAPFALMIGFWMLTRRTARTTARLPWLMVLAISGVLMGGLGSLIGGGAMPVLVALLGLAGVYGYVYWYSVLGRRPAAQLAVGRRLPALSLRHADGRSINIHELIDRPSILLFFRGNWCPLCMAQIREIAGHYQRIEKAGVRVALISPQPHRNTESLARKFKVNFDFLTDEHNQAAIALGIAAENGLPAGMQALGYDSDTVMPTVIITDAQAQVVWSDQTDNYRVRPEPETFLDVLTDRGLISS